MTSLSFIKLFEVELTNFCNAKCVFCPRDALTRPKGYMSFDLFKTIIEKAKELNISRMVFSGFGEPFLNKDILLFIQYLNQSAPAIELEIITNASLLTPETVEKLKTGKIESLVISFNGYDKKSYENTMRNLSYETTIENLKYLAAHGDQLLNVVKVRPVVTKLFDQPEIMKTHQLLLSLGFTNEHLKEMYLCANRGGYLNKEDITDDSFLKEKGITTLSQNDIVCTLFLNTLQIAWNGDILLCCNDINNTAKIGNIVNTDFDDIHKKIIACRTPGAKPEVCLNCNAPFVYNSYKKASELR
ncbi:MAG: radical SAM/SPASM domain-containing protein [Candidatus Margulisiibacteriota bacterium]